MSINARYLVVSIPIIESIDEKVFNATIRGLNVDKNNYSIKKVENILESFLSEHGIPLLKLSDYLDGAMYFPLNRHFNKSGNKKVAMLLAEYIETHCK